MVDRDAHGQAQAGLNTADGMSRKSYFIRWMLLCAGAELLGIASAATWYGGVHATLGEPEPLMLRLVAWLLMSLAAIPEGLILGGLQAIGVKVFIPAASARRWILATIFVGLLGWGIGTFIPMFIVTETPGAAAPDPTSELAGVMIFAAGFGLLIGAVFGAAQAWGLPRGGGRRWSWTIANAVGWAVALPMIYGAANIATEVPRWAAKLAIWAAGGCVAGLLIGIVTGVALLLMKGAEPRHSNSQPRA
jgi:hypothetical protein